MLRRIVITLCCLTALVVAFGFGSMAAIAMDWGKPLAVITVVNESGKVISSVEISISSCGTQRTLSQKSTDIQDHADLTFKLPLCGEGGHRTRIQFSDGRTVESPGSYIMNGSRIVERVRTDSIRSESSPLPY